MCLTAATDATQTADCMHSRRKVMLNWRPDTTNYDVYENEEPDYWESMTGIYFVHNCHEDRSSAVA